MAKPSEDLFLFVNPKSGGNKGQDFLKVPQPFLTQLDSGRTVSLHIFSLLDGREAGFTALKYYADRSPVPIRTIVGGGDGSIMWVDAEATKHGIDTSRQIVFGIIPLGTGNDFSRVAGWGGKNPKRIRAHDFRKLRKLVNKWCASISRPHDVWEVCISVEDDGHILKVDSGRQEKELPTKTMTIPMINYFSIGQDSKVGMEFDKHRTTSQGCNLLVYAFQGLGAEIDCSHIQHVGDLVSNLHAGTGPEDPILFGYEEEPSGDVPELVGNPESLMFLNVNSYAGGTGHFWQMDAPLGVEPGPPPHSLDVPADPGDGRLEVVTLPSIANIPLDQIMHEARRVHSGGPYFMEFFAPMEGQSQLDTYCEVDGEFYHLVNGSEVSVSFSKKLWVMQNMADKDRWKWTKYLSPNVWAPPRLAANLASLPSLAALPTAMAKALPKLPPVPFSVGDIMTNMPNLIPNVVTESR